MSGEAAGDWDGDFADAAEGEDDEAWLLDLECGLGADGQCMNAGSEHCDFECPYRDSEDFAGSEAWRLKKERSA